MRLFFLYFLVFITLGFCPACGDRGGGNLSEPGEDFPQTDTRIASCLQHVQEAYDRFFDPSWPPFCADNYGAGSFGRWVVDVSGDPAYDYAMNHQIHPDAAYAVTRGESRDHWHLVGNDALSAAAHNEGYVQLYDWSRGGKIINRWDPATENFSGGFKFISIDGQVFNTLYSATAGQQTRCRRFGMGYYEKVSTIQEISVTERIQAPTGTDPVLLSTTLLRNEGNLYLEGTLVEFWDVNLHELTFAPLLSEGLDEFFDRQRKDLNRQFLMDGTYDPAGQILTVQTYALDPESIPASGETARADYHPAATFLVALDPLPPGYNSYIADQDLFFGAGGLDRPPGATGGADGALFSGRSAYEGKAVLAFRHPFSLRPGETKAFHHLFGYGKAGRIKDLAEKYKTPVAATPCPRLEWLSPGTDWLSRELAWHSYNLQAHSYYQEFFDAFFIDQGSAYSYLHGLSGAHRDFALFALPMIYIRPDLAREMLRFSLSSQDAKTGQLPYAHTGYGRTTGAIIHEFSSDLDLFLLWALAEYLSATRDFDFLLEEIPFYPPSAGTSGTVLEHIRKAFDHLTGQVGLGPHGLLRCGSGDWNDVLVAYSDHPVSTLLNGESSLNAGLAALVLPAMASVLQTEDTELSSAMHSFAKGQQEALRQLWLGDRVARGYLGFGDEMLGADHFFLDTQAFGALAEVWDRTEQALLFDRVARECTTGQPTGALAMWPPMEGPLLDPGSDTNGGTWAAIDSWVAWAWSRIDPSAAWDFFLSTTLAAHAEAYPRIWYGIWSGPDSFNAYYHDRPGETFNGAFTPMTDYPVMNMNRHAGPLLDAIKLAGIFPRGDRLLIDPALPFESFAFRTPLVGIVYLPDRMRGYYAPIGSGTVTLDFRLPAELILESVILLVNGKESEYTRAEPGRIRFAAQPAVGSRIEWEILPGY